MRVKLIIKQILGYGLPGVMLTNQISNKHHCTESPPNRACGFEHRKTDFNSCRNKIGRMMILPAVNGTVGNRNRARYKAEGRRYGLTLQGNCLKRSFRPTISKSLRPSAVKKLKEHWTSYPQAEQALLAWYEEAEAAQWNSPNELKQQYRNASILTDKRVVFNIHGNSYRLIVDIEYRLKIVFVVWFGTHKQYGKIDAKKVSYVKADKK